jgi:hypothetical protein
LKAACTGAVFDLRSNAMRSEGGRRPTLAGLPIFAGLARHWASSHASPTLPPLGMRVRLKASVDISTYPADVQVILTALKKYGMILADNGGGFFVSGAPDPRWNDQNIDLLKRIKGSDFEVVQMVGMVQ